MTTDPRNQDDPDAIDADLPADDSTPADAGAPVHDADVQDDLIQADDPEALADTPGPDAIDDGGGGVETTDR